MFLLLATASACGGSRLLVGDNPGAAGAGPTGAAGSGTAGTSSTGAAGTSSTGAAGTSPTGSAGTGVLVPTPLAISGLEAVTRIANVLWSSSADRDVLVRAQEGSYATKDDLYPLIHAMLADPRAAVGVGKFYRWWLNLDTIATTEKDATLFPSYTPDLQSDMANETETFAVAMTLKTDGTYQGLMTSPSTFVNARLADIYGLTGVTGDALQPVMLDPTQRAGLLTQPGLQALGSFATRNSPTTRGVHIQEQFLCVPIPAPPANTPPFTAPAAGTTLRATLSAETAQAICQACHSIIDPPGFAFETFDAIGRWRTVDNGAPVNVSGLLLNEGDLSPTPFAGPLELATDLAMSKSSQQCLVRQWLAYVGNTTTAMIDDAAVAPVYASFQASSFNLQALIVAVLTSDTFLAP
jgi:hypothetical protein